jgi:L-2-hydroxyglutarate oxidase LhgO
MAYDYCVVGGGIVGLATAMKLLEIQPGARLVVLEKEAGLSSHQTGHTSGVIHAGIYYAGGYGVYGQGAPRSIRRSALCGRPWMASTSAKVR